jgi:hypothetical protein
MIITLGESEDARSNENSCIYSRLPRYALSRYARLLEFSRLHSGRAQGVISLLLILAPPDTATVSCTLYANGTVLNFHSFTLTCI